MFEFLTDLPERDKGIYLLMVVFAFVAVSLCLYVRWVYWRGYKAGYHHESLRLQNEELKFAQRMMRISRTLKGGLAGDDDEPTILPFPSLDNK